MTLLWAVLLLAGNAFFVAAEFALVASRRHRLEQALSSTSSFSSAGGFSGGAAGGSFGGAAGGFSGGAARGSSGRAGRGSSGGASVVRRRAVVAALAGTRELPVMLAGAQLGITLCSLGLGALAEPAIADLLGPVLHALGLPALAGHAIAFLVALTVVTFLHLVIGEMMPKSWAITHPERSAILLALPFRTFTRLAGPALRLLNALANLTLKPFGVRPPDELAQTHGPAEMQMLLDRSRVEGSLEAEQSQLLSSVLALGSLTVREVAFPVDRLVTVPLEADAAEIELASMAGGRSRLGVTAADGAIAGVVHVRDAARATTAGRPATAATLMDQPFTVDAGTRVVDAVAAMRAGRAQLALVLDGDRHVGSVPGFVAGSVPGFVAGISTGSVTGISAGPVTGSVTAIAAGSVTGIVAGSVTGIAAGSVTGVLAGSVTGFVALEDLLEQVIGRFDDETDPVAAS